MNEAHIREAIGKLAGSLKQTEDLLGTSELTKYKAEELGRMELEVTDPEGQPLTLQLPPAMMAIHLGMYAEAMLILNHMWSFSEGEYFNGCLEGDLCANYFGECVGQNDAKACGVRPGEVLIAHPDMPAALLQSVYEHDNCTGRRGRFALNLTNSEYLRVFRGKDCPCGYYFRLAACGLWNIRCKCPDLLYVMVGEETWLLTGMPEFDNGDPEEYRRALRDYTLFVKVCHECFKEKPEKFEILVREIDYGIRAFLHNPLDYITFGKEYGAYIRMLIDLEPVFRVAENTEEELFNGYCRALLSVIDSLYNAWSCKFSSCANNVRMQVGKWITELGGIFRKIVGNDPMWFIYRTGMNKDLLDPLFKNGNLVRIATLLQYACGYELTLDVADEQNLKPISQAFRHLENLEETPENHGVADRDSLDRGILAAVEFFDVITGCIHADLVFSEPERYRQNVETLQYIAEQILKLGNVELLEVALRKKLIPRQMYNHLLESATEKRTGMLPCLIAYKAAFGEEAV
ncbi:MAG: hypothetical protein K6B72_12940 [Lachnospiraceae bacterium]|nr:hypothetical protein [Lachnospiraceae bacterium]